MAAAGTGLLPKPDFAGEKVFILKPQTYMNNSGKAVAAALRELNLPLENTLIIYDDLALPPGGPCASVPAAPTEGQKGMRSIIEQLGENVPRLRLGIGADSALTPQEFVLSPFDSAELHLLEAMLNRAVMAVKCWLDEGITAAMNKFNGPVPSDSD